MTPTPELRTRLRKLLDEQIPVSGTEADTRFTDADLDELLTEAVNLYGAAAAGWTMKAGMYQREMEDLEGYSLGDRQEKLTSLRDRQAYALAMAQQYAAMAQTGLGTVILQVQAPEVI